MSKCRILFGVLVAIGFLNAGVANAQNYPNRPVRIIVPFPTGGSFDLVARLLGQQLSEQTKQSFVVENKPGASGFVGAQYVSSSKPDGYTLLYAGSSLTITPAITKSVPIDITKDLSPISKVVNGPYVLVINPSIPAKNVGELVAWIKQNPNKFKWAVSALGSADHLGTEVFSKMAGLPQTLVVPYVGTGLSSTAVMSNEVSGMLAPPSVIKNLVEAGNMRAIGVTGAAPIDSLPGVATIASQYPGYESGSWGGVFGAKDMPADLVQQIHDLIIAAMESPALQEKIKATGGVPETSKRPEDFANSVKSELAKYVAIADELKLKVD